jgi:hypothetical protein
LEAVRADLDSIANFSVQHIFAVASLNRVVVELLDMSDDNVAIFRRELLDSPLLVFQQANKCESYISAEPRTLDVSPAYDVYLGEGTAIPLNAPRLNPGNRILVFTNTTGTEAGAGSVGYRARLRNGGASGFVTAAHLGPVNWRVGGGPNVVTLRDGMTMVGRLADNSHIRLNEFDAVFITTTRSGDVSNRLAPMPIWPGTLRPIYTTPTEGSLVFHYGAPGRNGTNDTSFLNSGTFPNAIESIRIFNSPRHGQIYVFGDTIRMTLRAAETGDSGGIVFARISGTDDFSVHGILVSGSGMFVTAVRAWRINHFFGLEMY